MLALGAGRPCRRSRAPYRLCLLLSLLLPRAWGDAAVPAPAAAPAERPCRSRPGQGSEMVVIAAGRFLMGSPGSGPARNTEEHRGRSSTRRRGSAPLRPGPLRSVRQPGS